MDTTRWILASYLQRCISLSLDCQPTNAQKTPQWACLQLEGIQFGSCLRPRSSFSLESWRSHPKREIPGHFAHGLAVGDWSCSSIWSEAETPRISQLQDDFFTLRGPKGYDSFVFSATGVFREFFTKPLMIDLTVGGSEKAGQIIVQAGKTLLTPCCSFCSGGWRRDPGQFSVFCQEGLDCYRKCYQQKLRELCAEAVVGTRPDGLPELIPMVSHRKDSINRNSCHVND